MADGESAERAAAGSFSEAQLEAIAGVVQRLLDKALSEWESMKSSVPASEEREAADKSGDATPGKQKKKKRVCVQECVGRVHIIFCSCVSGGIACKSRAAGRDDAVVGEGGVGLWKGAAYAQVAV